MGEPRTVVVDLAALRAVAGRFDDAAAAVGDVHRLHLSALHFDGAGGGRAHTARADAVHTELTRLAAGLAGWARACTEIATAVRDGAARYAEAEAGSAGRLDG